MDLGDSPRSDFLALRVVQNAEIHLRGVRVPEADRLAHASSFEDTSKVLKVTRMGVAWAITGESAFV